MKFFIIFTYTLLFYKTSCMKNTNIFRYLFLCNFNSRIDKLVGCIWTLFLMRLLEDPLTRVTV